MNNTLGYTYVIQTCKILLLIKGSRYDQAVELEVDKIKSSKLKRNPQFIDRHFYLNLFLVLIIY